MTNRRTTRRFLLILAAMACLLTTALVSSGCEEKKAEETEKTEAAGEEGAATTGETGEGEAAPATNHETLVATDLSAMPPGDEGAQMILDAFLADGADMEALTMTLRPRDEDYAKIFKGPAADTARAAYSAHYDQGLAVSRKPAQTEAKMWSSDVAGFANFVEGPSQYFPGGYKIAAPQLQDVTFYRFKFVEPGEELGMGWDGLVYLDDHWVFVPKPWRALPGYQPPTSEMDMIFENTSPYDFDLMTKDVEGAPPQ